MIKPADCGFHRIMLAAKNRLKKKKDFENVFKNGKGQSEGFLYAKFVKNNLADSRFGFIVSAKFSKRAVARNKIKRWLREAIKPEEIKKGMDVAIIANPGFKTDNFSSFKKVVEKLLAKAKLTNK